MNPKGILSLGLLLGVSSPSLKHSKILRPVRHHGQKEYRLLGQRSGHTASGPSMTWERLPHGWFSQ
jgi:hypothetical protein